MFFGGNGGGGPGPGETVNGEGMVWGFTARGRAGHCIEPEPRHCLLHFPRRPSKRAPFCVMFSGEDHS